MDQAVDPPLRGGDLGLAQFDATVTLPIKDQYTAYIVRFEMHEKVRRNSHLEPRMHRR